MRWISSHCRLWIPQDFWSANYIRIIPWHLPRAGRQLNNVNSVFVLDYIPTFLLPVERKQQNKKILVSCFSQLKTRTRRLGHSKTSSVPPDQCPHTLHSHDVTAAQYSCNSCLTNELTYNRFLWPLKSEQTSGAYNVWVWVWVCHSAERLTVHSRQRCSCLGRGCLTPGAYKSPFAHCGCGGKRRIAKKKEH